MELRKNPYPGASSTPTGNFYPGLPVPPDDRPAGWITASTGAAAPYALLLDLTQDQETRRAALTNQAGTKTFVLQAPGAEQPHWRITFLIQDLTRALYTASLLRQAPTFTFTEWTGPNLAAIGQSRLTAAKRRGRAAMYILDLECVEIP